MPVAIRVWIATYQDLFGIGDDKEVIGREPTGNAPDRPSWPG